MIASITKKITAFIFLLISVIAVPSMGQQISYSGFIGNQKVRLDGDFHLEGSVDAVCVFSKANNPFSLKGTLKDGYLKLYKISSTDDTTATLIINNYDENTKHLNGKWQNLNSTKQFNVSLNEKYQIKFGEKRKWKNRDLLQRVSLKNYYFKIITSKKKNHFFAYASGLKIIDKESDSLSQQINFDYQLLGIDQVQVKDYNFDGIKDLSVFEKSYAGPNTSSVYYLFDPETKRFKKSNFSGTSLNFDEKKRRIYGRNQCCGGRSITTATYKVVDNKMVLVEHHCIEWDEKKQEHVEKPWVACQ